MGCAQDDADTKCSRVLAFVEDGLNGIACACLAVMVAVITVDSLGRAFFHAPLQIQFELTELYLMPAVAVLSLSRAYRKGAHLSLELFPERCLGRARVPIRLAMLSLAFAFCALITWKSSEYALMAWVRNDIYLGVVDWPLSLAYASAPIGFGVLTLRILNDVSRIVGSVKNRATSRMEEAHELN